MEADDTPASLQEQARYRRGFTLRSAVDLKAEWGLGAESELVESMARTIDRAIVRSVLKLVQRAKRKARRAVKQARRRNRRG